MDMSFLRRAQRILREDESLRLDHGLLVAMVLAQQAAATAARAERIIVPSPSPPADDEPLIELLLAGPRWREAASRQQGCFSRAEAGRRVNAP